MRLSRDVIASKIETKKNILGDLTNLVKQGGYQKMLYLNAKDELLQVEAELQQIEQDIEQLELQKINFIVDNSKESQELRTRLEILEFDIANQKYILQPLAIFGANVRKNLPIYRGEKR